MDCACSRTARDKLKKHMQAKQTLYGVASAVALPFLVYGAVRYLLIQTVQAVFSNDSEHWGGLLLYGASIIGGLVLYIGLVIGLAAVAASMGHKDFAKPFLMTSGIAALVIVIGSFFLGVPVLGLIQLWL